MQHPRSATLRDRVTLPLVLALVATASAPHARADEAWKAHAQKDGISVEKRPVPESRYYEYRATTTSAASPQVVLEALWTGITEALPATVKKRTVLRKSEDEYLVYDQIHTPVVSDRDVTIRIRRVGRPGSELREIHFEAVNELGPPPDPKYVRIPVVRGGWVIAPDAGGGSKLTYVCFSEPGGSIPAFLARGAQSDQIFIDVKRILARANARLARSR